MIIMHVPFGVSGTYSAPIANKWDFGLRLMVAEKNTCPPGFTNVWQALTIDAGSGTCFHRFPYRSQHRIDLLCSIARLFNWNHDIQCLYICPAVRNQSDRQQAVLHPYQYPKTSAPRRAMLSSQNTAGRASQHFLAS